MVVYPSGRTKRLGEVAVVEVSQKSDTDGSNVLMRVLLGLVVPVPARSASGVIGLVVDVVDTERGESGLVLFDESDESGLPALGDAFVDQDLPWSSR